MSFAPTRNVLAVACSAAFLLMAGCASKNPDWLSQPSGAYCADSINGQCLKEFAEKTYTESTARVVHKRKLESQASAESPASQNATNVDELSNDREGIEGHAVTPTPSTKEDAKQRPDEELEAPPQDIGTPVQQPGESAVGASIDEGSIPNLAFGIAAIGASINDANDFEPSDNLSRFRAAGSILNQDDFSMDSIVEVQGIDDIALQSDVLAGILTLHARSMKDDQVNAVLNDLYELDKEQYTNALIVKLPGLLREGDLERAAALREALLKSSSGTRAFSMLGYVASCYSMAGLKGDAGAIVRNAYADGIELSVDDKKLIAMAIKLGDGQYPMLQEFYDYQADEVRLQAYLTLTVIARQLDRPDFALRSIGDAVRFIQKSSVKLDRVKALGLILALSPGLL